MSDFAVDSHYCIGCTHFVCEDYARHGDSPNLYALVADGCSSSNDSDVGARLLILQAPQQLATFLQVSDPKTQHWSVGRELIQCCLPQAKALGLETTSLDSTLLIAYRHGDHFWVHCYGDGVIAAQDRDGQLKVIEIDFAHNAPYYLTYLTDSQRDTLYRQTVGEYPLNITEIDRQGRKTTQHPSDYPLAFCFPVAKVQYLVIATDGVSSLRKVPELQSLSAREVIEEALDFTLAKGMPQTHFVKRRLQQQLSDYSHRNIYNTDDVSFAVFLRVND